ncbi:MAG: hypothetical protein J6Q11_05965 [Fibrobacteraceae bacterium]|nr:hypothetical protein [Fibrobacteraceae bacterium]
MKNKCLLVGIISIFFIACSENSSSASEEFNAAEVCPESGRGTFVDERDGQEYKYTTIGNQVWMAENLNYDMGATYVFEPITWNSVEKSNIYNQDWNPENRSFEFVVDSLPDPTTGNMSNTRVLCFFPEDNCQEIGLAYNWYAASYACPAGWHLPSEEEFAELISRMGGDSEANVRLRSTTGWKELNRGEDLNGSDDCGFMLLPSEATYKPHIGYVADAWSSSEGSSEDNELILFFRVVSYRTDLKLLYTDGYKSDLKSIRCLKD